MERRGGQSGPKIDTSGRLPSPDKIMNMVRSELLAWQSALVDRKGGRGGSEMRDTLRRIKSEIRSREKGS